MVGLREDGDGASWSSLTNMDCLVHRPRRTIANHQVCFHSLLGPAPSLPLLLLAWSSASLSSQTSPTPHDHLRLSRGNCFPTSASTSLERAPRPPCHRGQEPALLFILPMLIPASTMTTRTPRRSSPTRSTPPATHQRRASRSLPQIQSVGDSRMSDLSMLQRRIMPMDRGIQYHHTPAAHG